MTKLTIALLGLALAVPVLAQQAAAPFTVQESGR
ncbi:MAG: hypothetical protein JWM38_2424, partial [Sphingomonas bacterium]|nr:hypothetical protein [Sphingomonas bacterium]